MNKLDRVILPRQRENKRVLKEALQAYDGISFRTLPDPEGDSATFLIFSLPSEDKARAFNGVLAEEGVGAVYWYDNLWHYYERWEHLLEGKSALSSGWPFRTAEGNPRLSYDPKALPRTADILSRALTVPIQIHMDDQIPRLLAAFEKAARKVL